MPGTCQAQRLTSVAMPCNACTMTTTQSTVGRLTTEHITAQDLMPRYRYLDAMRTEHTVASATMVPDPNDMGGYLVDVVTTSGREVTYKSWALLTVYVMNGHRDIG